MRKIILVISLLTLLTGLSAACASTETSKPPAASSNVALQLEASAPVKEAWQDEWERVVKDAKKERSLVFYTTAGAPARSALISGMKDRYGIQVETVSGTSNELRQKLSAERRAGLYLADVYNGGADEAVNYFKPNGLLEPVKPLLLLPEVADPKMWFGGKMQFIDKEGYILSFNAFAVTSLFINTAVAKPEDLKSYRDFLNPQWKGKIMMFDPTVPGSGQKWFGVVGTQFMGLEFMRQLARQEVVITRDHRQLVEWVAQGKAAIGIGYKAQVVNEFIEMGAPLKFHMTEEGAWLSSSSGYIMLINKAAHSNAAKVLINWMLTKEGQNLLSRAMGVPSRRLDVPTDHIDPTLLLLPGVKYFESETEEFLSKQPDNAKIAKEIFGIR